MGVNGMHASLLHSTGISSTGGWLRAIALAQIRVGRRKNGGDIVCYFALLSLLYGFLCLEIQLKEAQELVRRNLLLQDHHLSPRK